MHPSALAELSPEPQAPPAELTSSLEGVGQTRVLQVINGEHFAGAERVQDLLAGTLPALGFPVSLACLKPGQFAQVRVHRDAPLRELAMRGRFDLRPVRTLIHMIRAEGFGLLHAHTPRALLLAGLASRWTGVPLLYHVHSPAARDSTRRWQNRINAAVERLFLGQCQAVITVSRSLRDDVLAHGLKADKVVAVPNGVPRRTPRPERGRAETAWTLGTVALFRPRKGIEVLLEALALLRAEGLPVRLRAVGGFESPAYEAEVKRLVEQRGLASAIDWTGFTRDVDRQLATMDALVLPSLFGEGLPMVVLEAMAAGVPVVASRVEGIPEAIEDGREGLLAKAGDAADLARVLRCLLRGEVDWHSLRQAALKRQAEQFSERSMAAAVAAVYRRVLARA